MPIYHLRKYVHNHKYIFITMLGRREARNIVYGDGFPGLVGVGRGMYRPLFLMVGLATVQEM